MPAGPALRGLSRFLTLRLAMALVVVLGAMTGLALLAEAMNGGEGTVYLADLRQAGNGAAGVPSLAVVGLGRATAPAERATIQLMFNVDPSQYYNAPIRPADREGTPAPGEAAEAAAQPIVQAITSAGAPADGVTVVTSGSFAPASFPVPSESISFRIDAVVANPELETVSAIIDAAQVAGLELNLILSPVGVAYGLADCAPLQSAAWEAAVTDAESRAGVQAERLGVRLGAVVAASEASPDNAGGLLDAESRTGSCGRVEAPDTLSLYGLSVGAVTMPSFDPTQPAEVVAVSSVTVSYAIETE